MHPPARISFVIPVRNDAARLDACLRSIRQNSYSASHVEIIVVDNGSTDGSVTVATRAGARVLSVSNVGVSELRNIGAARASGDILAFVDADHEISAGWIATAVRALGAPDVAAAGALCHAPLDGTWVQRAYGALRGVPSGTHDVEWLGSGNMAVRRLAFDDAGGFDTSLTTCEDVDLCNRLRARGGRIVSSAQMRNVHYGDPATLWSLFKGELWRGQDNLRVSFRSKLTWRSLPSIIVPIVDIVMLLAGVLSLLAAAGGWQPGKWIAVTTTVIFMAGAFLRVARMVAREPRVGPLLLLQAMIVSSVYDLGRAAALITRAQHRSAGSQTVVAQ